MDRREFLKSSALTAGGLVIAFTVPATRRLAHAAEPQEALTPNAYLSISSDDTISVLLSKSEMGQGIWTTLPMLIAEELDADWTTIRVEHGPVGAAYINPVYGIQATGGSTSTWSEFDRYRQAGATARALLVSAAAVRFGVPIEQCQTKDGVVIAGKQKARYGDLAADASRLAVPENVPLKPPEQWRLIGRPTKRLDSPEKTTGQAQFGMDIQFPGLMTAVVARSPVFGGQLKRYDAKAALKIPGVVKVVQVPSGVAVVAQHFWAAKKGRDALSIDWEAGPGAKLDSAAMKEDWLQRAATPGAVVSQAGSVKNALDRSKKIVEADYTVPYLSHSPMEPLNCTVKLGKNSCELWVGTQFQSLDQFAAAAITGLKPEQVSIHTTFLGGGFGRRATANSDVVSEAVHVAKAAGLPVKTVWTREDDVRGGYYRSAFVHRARVGLDRRGRPEAWQHGLAGQSIAAGTALEAALVQDGVDSTSIEGLRDSPYLAQIPNHRIDLHSPQTPIPVLWWRSVAHSHTAFAVESLIDEVALAAGKSPLKYRRRLLSEHPRHLGVLNLAASKARYGRRTAKGRARGLAVHESFGSFVAQVAEVSIESGQIRVHRVVCAVDCGIAVNPEAIRAQIESGIAFGLSAALLGELHLDRGKVRESNFHDYRILRLDQMPEVEVHIVDSQEKPGGIGEVGVPPIAPAVANAVAALTGQRLRDLPLTLTS